MPAPYYADGNLEAGGADLGTLDNPWLGALGFQNVLDNLDAGEVGYVRGTFVLDDGSRDGGEDGTALNLDTNSGSSTSPINVYGTNGSWVVDGTLAIVNGADVAPNCLLYAASKYYWNFHNITFQNATGDGVDGVSGTTTIYATFVNCHFDDNGGHGFDGEETANLQYVNFIKCSFNGNGGRGCYGQMFSRLYFCEAIGNGNVGFTVSSGSVLFACIAHDNKASYGIGLNGGVSAAICCVSDGNVGDGFSTQYGAVVIGCRSTNNTVASFDPAYIGVALYNYYDGSMDDPSRYITEVNGVETNLMTGLEGYEDRANDKFNLIKGAAGFRTSIAIDSDNDAIIAMGLPTVPIVWPREN